MAKIKNLTVKAGWISVILNTLLFLLKFWAGTITGSLALIADAWHTLTDSVTSVIVIIGGKISKRPANEDHPFGYGRIEHIGAIVIGVLLAIVGFDFLVESIKKFNSHEKVVFGPVAIWVTAFSIIAKEGLAQYSFWASKKSNSQILKADAWHHRSDALSSLIILVGIFLGPYFWWVDSVLGFIVSIMIFLTSFEILKRDAKSLLGKSLNPEIVDLIVIEVNEGLKKEVYLHHLHLHEYGNHSELSCHIKLPPEMSLQETHEICTKIENIIKLKFNYITTVHPEPLKPQLDE